MNKNVEEKSEEQDPPDTDAKLKRRTAAPGKHRCRDNGPIELAVEPVEAPDPKTQGTLTRYSHEVITGGSRALLHAEHRAAELAEQFGIEFEAKWCLKTTYLTELEKEPINSTRGGKRPDKMVKYALMWRPRFLAVLALSRSTIFACRAAKISNQTAWRHRAIDTEFNEQCLEAEAHAIQLLHDVTMKSAIEGEVEPVFWQGIPVGHIKNIDNRLRIEMLRAHMPQTFKTPGAKIAINTGDNIQNNFIFDEKARAQLVKERQEFLLERKALRDAALPATVIDTSGMTEYEKKCIGPLTHEV